MNLLHSPAVGIVGSFGFFLVNSVFLGNTLFKNKESFLRFAFGAILLVAVIGIVGWIVLIVYNLDAIRSTIVLLIVATISSLPNKLRRYSFSIEIVRED